MSPTLQEGTVILHALEKLEKTGYKPKRLSSLSARLRSANSEMILGLEFSEDEIQCMIMALELALKEIRDTGGGYYGCFSIFDLERLLEKIEKLLKVF